MVRTAKNVIAHHRKCTLVLAGGSKPRGLYERLASEPYRQQVDWSKVQLFFGDERCVPPDAPESNYRMVRDALLSKIPNLEKKIYRIQGELAAEKAASLYEEKIRETCGEGVPPLDLVLLGMGPDA